MKKKIDTFKSIADSELISYSRQDNTFTVNIHAWNASLITATFIEFEGAADYGLGDISEFVEETDSTDFLGRVLVNVYEEAPETHPYHLYQFLNLDGEPALEVVATDVKLTYE